MASAPSLGTPPPPHDPSMPFRGSSKPPPAKKSAPPAKRSQGSATGPFPPMPPPGATTWPSSTPTTLTPEQQLVQQWVTAAQLPQMQAIQNEQAASSLAAKNSATTTAGYYQALAKILGSIGPQTQAGYQQAAGADSAFGKGFANGLAMVQDQAGQQTNDALGVAGAPPAQTAQANAALGGTGATDALYALGGYIPATTMSREGAAFGAAADLLPATAGGQGAQAIQGIAAQQRLDQQGFAKQYADLAAQAPGLALEFGSKLDAQKAAQLAHDDRVAAQNATDVYRTSMLELQRIADTGYDKTTGKLTPKAQAEWNKVVNNIKVANERVVIAQQNADANSSRATTAADKARGYTVDAQGVQHVLPGFKVNPDGTVSKVGTSKWVPGQPVLSSVGKMRVNGYGEDRIAAQLKKWHPNWTAEQIAATLKAAPKLYGDMTKAQVEQLRAQAGSLKSGRVFTPKDPKKTFTMGGKHYKYGQKIPHATFGQALTVLVESGYSRADATAMLNRFYPRGKRR